MSLLHLVTRLRGDWKLTELATTIAERSRAAVWNRVGEQIAAMPLVEAKGYMRARAASVVHYQTDTALAGQRSIKPALRARLIDLAMEEVIRAMLAGVSALAPREPATRQAA